MAATVLELSPLDKTQLIAYVTQFNESNQKRMVRKTPVENLPALLNVVHPCEGEVRQNLAALPSVDEYVFHSTLTSATLQASDGTVGGWIPKEPPSVSEEWQAGFDYASGDLFNFYNTLTGAVDADGIALEAGVLYAGSYADNTVSPAVAQSATSGTVLNIAEMALIKVVNSSSPVALGETITQAEMDAIMLLIAHPAPLSGATAPTFLQTYDANVTPNPLDVYGSEYENAEAFSRAVSGNVLVSHQEPSGAINVLRLIIKNDDAVNGDFNYTLDMEVDDGVNPIVTTSLVTSTAINFSSKFPAGGSLFTYEDIWFMPQTVDPLVSTKFIMTIVDNIGASHTFRISNNTGFGSM